MVAISRHFVGDGMEFDLLANVGFSIRSTEKVRSR